MKVTKAALPKDLLPDKQIKEQFLDTKVSYTLPTNEFIELSDYLHNEFIYPPHLYESLKDLPYCTGQEVQFGGWPLCTDGLNLNGECPFYNYFHSNIFEHWTLLMQISSTDLPYVSSVGYGKHYSFWIQYEDLLNDDFSGVIVTNN